MSLADLGDGGRTWLFVLCVCEAWNHLEGDPHIVVRERIVSVARHSQGIIHRASLKVKLNEVTKGGGVLLVVY